MDAEGPVHVPHQGRGERAAASSNPLDRNRPHLVSLRLGVPLEPRHVGPQEHLEGVDPIDV